MLDGKQLWALAQETVQAFTPFYREAMRKAIQDSGVPDQWLGLNRARGCDPEPLTVERYHAMSPYTARERVIEILEKLAGVELLERVGENAYRLTDQGREIAEGVFEVAHQGIGTVEPLPAAEMDQLNSLLYRIVEATLKAPEPEEKWAIAGSRWTDPGEDAPGAVKTDQYLTDLNYFRDDAHIAAWKPYDVSGHAWDALTFIWRGEASTAEELAEKLPYRAHTVEDYQEAFQDLVARGWVSEDSGAYKLTEKGKRIREEAEEATDRHFFVGWSALSEGELAQLEDLLTRAKANLGKAALVRLWGLAREVSGAIYAGARDAVTPLFEKYELDKPGRFFALNVALGLEPELVSAALLAGRAPYTNPDQCVNLLPELAGAGFLASKEDEQYALTEKGRAVWQELHHAFYTRLGEISALPAEDLAQLESLLDRLAVACLDAQEPADKWWISTTHRAHPDGEYAPLAKIDQHLDDLSGFRNDAHFAAWKPYDVSGQAWEALTFVWRGEANTAEELVEKLPFRAYTVEDYQEALQGLAGRGWIAEESGAYKLTEEGKRIREEAEEATNHYFFAPWTCLSEAENAQLRGLLTQLRDDLRKMAGENGEAE